MALKALSKLFPSSFKALLELFSSVLGRGAIGALAQLLFRLYLVELVQLAIVQRAERVLEVYTST